MSLSKLQANKMPSKNAIFDETTLKEEKNDIFDKHFLSLHLYDITTIIAFEHSLFMSLLKNPLFFKIFWNTSFV